MRNSRRALGALVLAALVPACLGCSSGAGLATVAGQVKINGEPVGEGTIDFRAADGKTATASAAISQGAYTCEVPPGPKKIVIRAYKVVGQERASQVDPNSPMIDRKEQVLPAKYSDEAATELKQEISSSGNRSLNFDLKVP